MDPLIALLIGIGSGLVLGAVIGWLVGRLRRTTTGGDDPAVVHARHETALAELRAAEQAAKAAIASLSLCGGPGGAGHPYEAFANRPLTSARLWPIRSSGGPSSAFFLDLQGEWRESSRRAAEFAAGRPLALALAQRHTCGGYNPTGPLLAPAHATLHRIKRG